MNSNLFRVVIKSENGHEYCTTWYASLARAKVGFERFREAFGATHAISIRAKGKRAPYEDYYTVPVSWLAPR